MTVAFIRTGSAAARPEHAAAREIASDEVLIRRIAGGDQLAMQTEDLLSDVFLDVWRQAAKFEARSSVSTWLLAIARYKTLSARRRRIDAELDEEVSVIIADPADNPELVLQKKNQAELVRHSLARLSPEHGEVIDLVYYHGKSVREVAEIVGVAAATVKTRMFYARKKLAELFEAA